MAVYISCRDNHSTATLAFFMVALLLLISSMAGMSESRTNPYIDGPGYQWNQHNITQNTASVDVVNNVTTNYYDGCNKDGHCGTNGDCKTECPSQCTDDQITCYCGQCFCGCA
ncbi:hypothetical protein LINPERPRIM_LOCUS2590 [Linum perenne]